ncbi:glucuronate isomerase [Marinoscillum sp. MHG1-6]|uniref:glucuronate isomerase n=1 Tax=Marinoscillum sp. MHG1-6 TaxID=2959627 RepID=UPI002157111A|nr:glucuronate isomerase [Marinoscillum sp. MHG1-6]
MKKFLGDDFLLTNKTAEKLYHDHAAKMPIIDYHNHLPPKDIQGKRVFNNITEAWLEGDHYKWRAMRTNAVDEKYVTGDASPEEKFQKWAETVPYTLKNPLYHWTHLELKRYFGIDTILNGNTGMEIYQEASSQLKKAENSCPELLKKMNVEVVCTTDDPVDTLEFHQTFKDSSLSMYPAFRPDKIYAIDNADSYKDYLKTLSGVVGFEIRSFDDLMNAAQNRIDFFHENGGRLSDHGLEQLYDVKYSISNASQTFTDFMVGKELTTEAIQVFKMSVLFELSKMYNEKGWTQQFHLGAIRNNNAHMMKLLGPDTGFDSIGDFSQIKALSKFLGSLEDKLTKTILYNLNPADNEAFATMIGNFNVHSTVPGKIQWGSGWWFLDQKDGMEKQMTALGNLGLLSRFVGMLTDSRSFLSFPRHEYFRRILCNLIGTDVENGEIPNDLDLLGKTVEDICYNNARNYFEFGK